MTNTFLQGKPVNYVEIDINDSVELLDSPGHNFAVVQFQDPVGNYAGIESNVARYNRQGIDPTISTGFIAGLQDQIVFSNDELREGVKILNSQTTLSMRIVVQYYTFI